ncbi:MAG: hypothetical protein LBH03_03165 [Holophagales bacterium]|nr:hypothetical protein [Holophagales bacterium]
MDLRKLLYGDNLKVLPKYVSDESVDLCYIDPPFNSNRNYNYIYNSVGGARIVPKCGHLMTLGHGIQRHRMA